MLQSRYVNRGRSFTPTTSYTTSTKNNTHLENKLQWISNQLYPPKTSHSCLQKMVLSHVFQALRGIFSTSKTPPTDLGALEDSPSFNASEVFQHSPCAARCPVRPRRALVIRGIANFVRWFCVIFFWEGLNSGDGWLDFSEFAGLRWEGHKI